MIGNDSAALMVIIELRQRVAQLEAENTELREHIATTSQEEQS